MTKSNILFMGMTLLLFASCGDSRTSGGEESTTTNSETEVTVTERNEGDTIQGATTDRVVDLEAKDHVYFPREIKAKPGEQFYVNLINNGNEGHNVHLELPQAPVSFGEPVPTGQSRRLIVRAPDQPGQYQIFCPVADHKDRGMVATLIVE